MIANLSKWLEQADEDNSHKDWETSSQDTSKKSHTHKSSQRDKKGRRAETSDDPRSNRENYEREYWNSIDIPGDRIRVWNCADQMLLKYYELLNVRQNLVEETGKMHMQNEELKTLLKQYLQANINQELIVPPTDVIRYDADEV